MHCAQDQPLTHQRRWRLWRAALILWLVGVLSSLYFLARYERTPGKDEPAPEVWPAKSKLPRTPGRSAMVVFAHPKCPCTVATIEELAQLVSRTQPNVDLTACFFAPENPDPGWMKTLALEEARRIDGLRIVEDVDGEEARRFHIRTSGRVVFYDPNGRLEYDGGITPGRGINGPANGSNALAALLSGNTTEVQNAPVYGCNILGK